MRILFNADPELPVPPVLYGGHGVERGCFDIGIVWPGASAKQYFWFEGMPASGGRTK
jgi:hypothetical protein